MGYKSPISYQSLSEYNFMPDKGGILPETDLILKIADPDKRFIRLDAEDYN